MLTAAVLVPAVAALALALGRRWTEPVTRWVAIVAAAVPLVLLIVTTVPSVRVWRGLRRCHGKLLCAYYCLLQWEGSSVSHSLSSTCACVFVL